MDTPDIPCDATLASCCQRDAKQRKALEKQMEELRKVDLSMQPLIARRSVIGVVPDVFSREQEEDDDERIPDVIRQRRLSQLLGHSHASGALSDKERVRFVVNTVPEAESVKEWIRSQNSVIVAYLFSKQNNIHEERLARYFAKQGREICFLRIQVATSAIAESCFAIHAVPSLAVFRGGRLAIQSRLRRFIDQRRLDMSQLVEALLPYIPQLKSDDEENDDELDDRICLVCGRDYPHEHIPQLSAQSTSDKASSSDDDVDRDIT